MTNAYRARRERLAQRLPEGGAMLLFSGEELPMGVDMTYPFSVDRNFYYLTGLDLPCAAVYVSRAEQRLYLPPFDPKREQYEGPQPTCEALCAAAGFACCEEFTGIEQIVAALPKTAALYLDLQRDCEPLVHTPAVRAKEAAMRRGMTAENGYSRIFGLRTVKDAAEIEAIRRAVEITGEALDTMVKTCRAGMREYEWQAAFEMELCRRGCGCSFPSIVASGKNAVYLHYVRNDAIVQNGELFLFDVGAYYQHYASDISRTYPVGGRFSPRQRELYEFIYDATRLVLEHMKPHHRYGEHVRELQAFFARYLQPLHIADTVEERDAVLRMLSRGCCHHLGLDAHDGYAALDDELLPGMVFTNEPGVYLGREGIGIRIEEDLLITEQGNELLSADIPASAADIEARMG